ncbi:hypothetical protein JXA88_08665 [Candidatus Fermentibacteria bacterium]|nr:hypothetical protein [Candidatus Fermentibacteria bacterium]
MFRTRKRSDEENGTQAGKTPIAPQELLAKEAAMAERLLGDLIPEEPPAKKEPEQPKPPAPEGMPPGAPGSKPDMKAVEPPPIPQPATENAPKTEEKPVDEKPVELKPSEPKPEGDQPAKDDQLPEMFQRIQTLGVELVQIRNEIMAAREKYSGKTKELETLQEKLKGLLGQFS